MMAKPIPNAASTPRRRFDSDGLRGASATRHDPTSPAHPKAVDEPEVWRASVRRIAKAKNQANDYKTKARAEPELYEEEGAGDGTALKLSRAEMRSSSI